MIIKNGVNVEEEGDDDVKFRVKTGPYIPKEEECHYCLRWVPRTEKGLEHMRKCRKELLKEVRFKCFRGINAKFFNRIKKEITKKGNKEYIFKIVRLEIMRRAEVILEEIYTLKDGQKHVVTTPEIEAKATKVRDFMGREIGAAWAIIEKVQTPYGDCFESEIKENWLRNFAKKNLYSIYLCDYYLYENQSF